MRAREQPRSPPSLPLMKPLPLLLALTLLPLSARSETLDLGLRGTFTITPPQGWTLSTQKEEDSGVALTFTPPSGVNAACLLNITFVPAEEKVTKEQVQESVLQLCEQFVDQSVEKKKVLKDITVEGGYGYYCAFTDASLVGQPTKKDSFKVMGVGIIHFSDELMATVGLSCDDLNGDDFKAMLAMVSGATYAPKK